MKQNKLFLGALAVLLILPFSAMAQSVTPKHEISVSYGILPATEFINMFAIPIISIGAIKSETTKSLGAINVSYAYKLNKWIAVGGTYSYSQFSEELHLLNKYIGSSKNTYHTVMPTAKFSWLNKRIISLYSKAALGVTICSQKPNYTTEETSVKSSTTNAELGFQFTPIGIEVGNTVAVFAEAGIGNSGCVILGLRFRF